MTEKLWVIMVGGYPEGAHVEVHDIRFAIGAELRDTFPALKAQWWGGGKVHIDAWGALEWADGYRVVVCEEGQPPDGADQDLSLWFVQLGGYDPAIFAELHENIFVAAATAAEAKARGLAVAKQRGWSQPHRDTQMQVEMATDVRDAARGSGKRVYLVPSDDEKVFTFTAKYLANLD